jgi:hypothetical protein
VMIATLFARQSDFIFLLERNRKPVPLRAKMPVDAPKEK